MKKKSNLALTCFAIFGILSSNAALAEEPPTPGNRYDLPRLYDSEISAAKAYILTNHDRGNKGKDAYSNAVIIDVRRVSEHVDGHPPGSYSIPFPHIAGSASEPNDSTDYIGYDISGDSDICFVDGCENGTYPSYKGGVLDVSMFVNYVEAMFPDKTTPILTLCRTGYRSVQAANLLQKAGYENVRNIWEGYVGKLKYAYTGSPSLPDSSIPLDLNNDDVVDASDSDGWSAYQELPTTTKLHPGRIFSPYSTLYYQ